MNYQDLINGTTVRNIADTVGTRRVKQLTKSMNRPYVLRDSVDGPKTKVVFDEHFIERFQQVESNECTAKMSKLEKELYWDYITYQDAYLSVSLSEVPVVESSEEEKLSQADSIYRSNRKYRTPTLVVVALGSYDTANVYLLEGDGCFNTNYVWNQTE